MALANIPDRPNGDATNTATWRRKRQQELENMKGAKGAAAQNKLQTLKPARPEKPPELLAQFPNNQQ